MQGRLCSIACLWGVYLHPIYKCIVLDIAIKLIWCTSMQGIYAWLTMGVYLHPIYKCIVLDIAIKLIWCTSMQVKLLCLTLSWGYICIQYISFLPVYNVSRHVYIYIYIYICYGIGICWKLTILVSIYMSIYICNIEIAILDALQISVDYVKLTILGASICQ